MPSAVSPRIAVLGSLNMDVVVRTPRAPNAGESVIGSSYMTRMGGKGATQAIAAHRMGGLVTLAGAVGEDAEGRALLEHLRLEGLEDRHIERLGHARTGAAFVFLEESGQNRIVSVPGANLAFGRSDLERTLPVLAEAQLLVLQLEMHIEVVSAAIVHAHTRGIPVVLNPGPLTGTAFPQELFPLLHGVTPNETEAGFLTGIAVDTVDDAKRAARRLRSFGVPRVAVTLGERGVVIAEGEDVVHIPGLNVRAVDTVGAGDTFTGALAAQLGAGADFLSASRVANAAAALSVTREGASASIPYRKEVMTFLTGED